MGFIEDQGYEAMRAWIAEGDAEAVFAVNDPVAIGAMHALTEAGYRAGHDIAVVGAGNIHYGDMLSVPLTTVAWPTAEIGQQAARLLIEMIEGDASSRAPQNVVVPPISNRAQLFRPRRQRPETHNRQSADFQIVFPADRQIT